MSTTGTSRVADVRLSAFERLPWRRIILLILGVVITTVVVVGAYKTLTLPADEAFSAEGWKNLVVQGIAQGAILAMIALGYSLVYGILRMINFAHGEVFMAGAFISFFFADAFAKSGFLDDNPIFALAIVMAVAIASSLGTAVLLERLAYRPLRNAPRLVPLITAIGASLFLQNAFRGFFGPQPYAFPRPEALDGNIDVLGVEVRTVYVLVFVVAIASMVVLQAFVARSRTGRSMRAVAEDREIASLMGIDVDRTIRATFAIGGGLAGVAAVLYCLSFQQVVFTMGFRPGIAAFTAAVLGGIGSITGAALGGFLLGILQAVGPQLFLSGFGIPSPNSLRDAFVFLVLVLVLVFRPGGLLGSGEAEKV
ncbi:MAG: branched-chain amino acid ABC transporter permease [Actinomycetota bacterium]